MLSLKGNHTDAVIYTQADPLENAVEQVQDLIDNEVSHNSTVKIMPDYHSGKGCVIGTTMTIHDRVNPALVGVDIGCGVLAIKFKTDELNLEDLDNYIKENIPHGKMNHLKPTRALLNYPQYADSIAYLQLKHNINIVDNVINGKKFNIPNINTDKLNKSLGTLGGGNHFIEIGQEGDDYWLFVHTGSRYLGVQVAKFYTDVAELEHYIRSLGEYDNRDLTDYVAKLGNDVLKYDLVSKREEIIKYHKDNGTPELIQEELKKLNTRYSEVIKGKPELPYITGKNLDNYLNDMYLAQEFAFYNRLDIALTILSHLNATIGDIVNSTHNYIESVEDIEMNQKDYKELLTIGEDFKGILRKGAISAYTGEKLLIPLNMSDGVIIGKGKGNGEWNCSAPHGAGRIRSRKKSFELLNMSDFNTSMEGIYTSTATQETLDESPKAYKPIEHILEVIGGTIDVECIVKPIYNFKAVD